jgi:NadR type nicotinamide-nucleotide adenylyltransferase
MESLKKIVIIGPESTGKITFCEALARHYQTDWVHEFAREYLLASGMAYTYDDLLTIAKGQIGVEDEMKDKAAATLTRMALPPQSATGSVVPFFIDTDLYVMKVWCEFVFGKCHQWIIDQIVERSYDLYLLCNTDLPWTKDELREYPDLGTRETLFHIYKDIMVNQNTPWIEIIGIQGIRTQRAIEAINSFLLQ